MRRLVVAGVMVAGVAVAAGAPAQEQEAQAKRERLYRPSAWTPMQTGWKHLKVREGWTLYPLSRGLLMHHHPFACAVRTELAGGKTQGHMVGSHNIGRFIEPVQTPEAAAELLAFFIPGVVVQDRAALDRAVAAFRRQGATAAGYAITVHDFRPERCGLRAAANKQGFDAWGVFYENDRQLNLVEAAAAITTNAAGETQLTLERTPIVTGPPTAWQTAMDPNATEAELRAHAAEQKRAYAEIDHLKRSLAATQDARRTLAVARTVLVPGVTMKQIRAALGTPDGDIGSGLHIWRYILQDGTELLVGEAGGPISYAHHVRPPKDGGKWETLERFVTQW